MKGLRSRHTKFQLFNSKIVDSMKKKLKIPRLTDMCVLARVRAHQKENKSKSHLGEIQTNIGF